MSFLRVRSSACFRAGRLAAPVNARFVTTPPDGTVLDKSIKTTPSEPPTTPPSESTLIRKETPSEAIPRHQPDYNATVDHATSYVFYIAIPLCLTDSSPSRSFSPVPKRVMDGSEPGDAVAAAVISGAPVDLQARTVRYGY